jgi:hypothetical protein
VTANAMTREIIERPSFFTGSSYFEGLLSVTVIRRANGRASSSDSSILRAVGRAIGRGRCSRCSPFVQVDARYVAQMWQVFGRIVRGAVRVESHRRCRQTDASSLESELT